MARCPCGGESYARCCGRFHRGQARAATALELMKSRYAAFARAEWRYLEETHHPSRRRAGAGQTLRWTGLEIVHIEDGGPGDDTGVVEFVARHEGGELRERSLFVKEDGVWYYLEGR